MPILGQPITQAIDANPTGFLGALTRIERATKDTFGGMSGPLRQIENIGGNVTAQFRTMVGVLTGGVIGTTLISSARAAIEFGDEISKASARTGIAVGEMSRLAVAAKQTDLDLGTLLRGFKELQTSLSRAATGTEADAALFRALGIELGKLKAMRPEEQLGVIADRLSLIADPADRARVGTELLGKAYGELVPLLEKGSAGIRELIAEQERLGNVMSGEQIQKLADADDAIKRLSSSWQGFARTLTAAVAPALSSVLDVLSGANRTTEEGLKDALAGAQYELRGLEQRRASIKGPRIDTTELDKDIAEARAKVDSLLGQLLPGVSATSQRRGGIDLSQLAPPDKTTKSTSDPSILSGLQAQLEARKYVFEKENEGREFSKAQELAFWREILETTKLSTKDQEQAVLKFRRLEVEVAREASKQLRDIDQAKSDGTLRATLAEIDAADARAEGEVAAGRMTQTALLSLQREFNEARLVEEIEFLDRKRAVLQLDPDRNLVALEQLEQQKAEIRERYAAKGAEIIRAQAAESRKPVESIVQAFQQSLGQVGTALLTNWRNIGQALRGVLASIGQSIIQEIALKPLQARLAAWVKERGLVLAGIGADAAKAGSGAAASQASIPIIGPVLAIGAMAAILAAVGGMAGKVPSAAGGFDIPRGMNPLTQLHEREMVLPATLADTVRDMAQARGAEPAARAPASVQLRATNVGRDFLMMNRNDLAEVLRVLGAEFKLRP